MIPILISSAFNLDIYKTNTCSSFKNRLPRLTDALQPTTHRNRGFPTYSIAMTDFWYPSKVLNVSERGNEITLVHIDKDDVIVKVSVQAKFYPTVQSLVDSVNLALKPHTRKHISFLNSDVTERTFMVFKKSSKFIVSLGRDLALILGFKADTPYFASVNEEFKIKSDFQSSVQGNLDHMLIYCDAIEQSYMANELTNIFAMISRKYDLERRSLHVPFENPVWHKLENGANIESIQFTITDMSGQPFAFYDGVTTVGIQIKRDESNEN